MEILNLEEIGTTPLRRSALEILAAGVESVMPERVLSQYVNYIDGKLKIKNDEFEIGDVYVLGCGKAVGLMAYALEKIIPLEKIKAGIVNSIKNFPTKKIIINVANHPIPDERGLYGVEKMLELIKQIKPEDTVIGLFSGGGSALLPDLPPGIELGDIQRLTELFIKSGAETYEMNIFRKHVSTLKGGNLAKILQPSRIISLMISDDLDGREDIASRPTTYEDSTFQEAYDLVRKYHILEKIPKNIRIFLEKGLRNEIPENPKKGESFFENVYNYILADNKTALESMRKKADSLGFNSFILAETLKGETKISARNMGKLFSEKYSLTKTPLAILYSAETIVKVKGNGKGGRAQEFTASLIPEISGKKNSVFAAIGSDGIDFIPGIGGAIIDDTTLSQCAEKGLELPKFLKENDTYNLHKYLGNLILMNSTNTNVGDLHVYLQKDY
ncbi:MAG: DUF4147 domain-containing protein [Nanoarchaeota archaeon]